MNCLIALHRAPGLIGSLIRWQQRGGYSHASLVFPGAVIESREFIGVRQLPALAPVRGESIALFSIKDFTDVQAQAAYDFATAQIGKPYDWPMVFGFVSRSEHEGQSELGKWFCSELVYAAVKAAGVDLLRAINAWEVSPSMLARSPQLLPASSHL